MGHRVSKKRFWALVEKAMVLEELERELHKEWVALHSTEHPVVIDLPIKINGISVEKKEFSKKVADIENPSLWVGM